MVNRNLTSEIVFIRIGEWNALVGDQNDEARRIGIADRRAWRAVCVEGA